LEGQAGKHKDARANRRVDDAGRELARAEASDKRLVADSDSLSHGPRSVRRSLGIRQRLALVTQAGDRFVRISDRRKKMAQRATELIGKSVVSADTGEKLGTVADVLFDEADDHRLVGLVVRHGWRNTEAVLPAEAVHALGKDAVMSRTRGDLVPPREWREQKRQPR